MFSAISPKFALQAIPLFPKQCPSIPFQSLISEKIQKIAYPLFQVVSSLYLCSTGILEITQNTTKKAGCCAIDALTKKTLTPSTPHLKLHGTLLFNSGSFSLLGLLHEFGVINIGAAASAINAAGSVFFLCANIVDLEENIHVYQEIQHTDWTKTNIDEKELCWLKNSARLGILSSIGYILTTATLLFNGFTAVTLLIAALSCFAGGVKILYDLRAHLTQKVS